MREKIMHSQEMKLRVMQLEYEDLSDEAFKQKVEHIYIEMYGEKIPADIEICSTSDSKTGYQGTALHFQSQENAIDEMYIISPGTQNVKDWEYNLHAMLTGDDITQTKEVNKFVKKAKAYFGINESANIIGLAHSLGHNNNATAHLLYNTFDYIFSANGAQTNVYQIFNNDSAFRKAVNSTFSLDTKDEIYNIAPDKLEAFAKGYYNNKGKNIYQIISEDDPLYAISGIRGFFTLGDIQMYDTNPEYPGLRSIVDEIPDDAVKDIQEIAIKYTTATKYDDINEGIQALTGINLVLINKLDSNPIKAYISYQKEIDQMAYDMNEKLPDIFAQIKNVTAHADQIFQCFVDAAYINTKQKELIVNELSNIQVVLEDMQKAISFWSNVHEHIVSFSPLQISTDLGMYISLVLLNAPAIKSSLDNLNRDDLRDTLHMILDGHSIQKLLNAVVKGRRTKLIPS